MGQKIYLSPTQSIIVKKLLFNQYQLDSMREYVIESYYSNPPPQFFDWKKLTDNAKSDNIKSSSPNLEKQSESVPILQPIPEESDNFPRSI